MKPDEIPKFIADINVGKLARWLRALGYDTLVFRGQDDGDLLTAALAEDRIILTRDSGIPKRRLITHGQVKAILIDSVEVRGQAGQVLESLKQFPKPVLLTRCVEDNEPLLEKTREEVRDCVPPFVYQTQNEYTQCPVCRRVYWKGTHWQAMTERLKGIKKDT